VTRADSPYTLLLRQEVEAVRRSRDAYLFHEHLEEVNEPLYFHQFAERAAAHGLRYLGEADLTVMAPGNFPPEVASVLQVLSADLIHLEQYMDFLRNRMFRQTLLCHRHLTPNYALRPEQLAAFHVASPTRPVSEKPDMHSTAYEKFEGRDGITLNSRDPIMKAAMRELAAAWPRALPFEDLRAAARARLGQGGTAADAQQLGQGLLRCYTSAATNLVELHRCPPQFTLEPGERPCASPLARLQAAQGGEVTNLRHETVRLADFDRHLLRHLDGRRDRAALLDALEGLAARGELQVQQDGKPVRERPRVWECLGQGLEQQLPALARQALFVS
jgi:methyltransferase-like protein